MKHAYQLLPLVSSLYNVSIYVVDFYKQKFAYVSENPLFLCGYTSNEVKKYGLSYLEQIVPEADRLAMNEVNLQWLDILYDQPPQQRSHCFLTSVFQITNRQGKHVFVKHIAIPLYLTPEGHPLLMICFVSHSLLYHSLDARIFLPNNKHNLTYSFQKRNFIATRKVKIYDREREVIKLIARGLTETDVANELSVSVHDVKYHKRKLFGRIKVKNCYQALLWMAAEETMSWA